MSTNTIAPEHLQDSDQENPNIEQEVLMLYIPNIKAQLSSQEMVFRPLIWAQPLKPGVHHDAELAHKNKG